MSIPLVTASGVIRHGRLVLHNRRLFDEAVRGLREGWEVDMALTRFRATRSVKQNAYYHGYVLQRLMEHTGIKADVLHDMMKVKFLSRTEVVLDHNGDVVDKFILGKSTAPLKTHEFSAYVDEIRQWAAEKLQLDIKDPDPSWRSAPPEELEDADAESHPTGYGAGI
jgi:hypothetical protein